MPDENPLNNIDVKNSSLEFSDGANRTLPQALRDGGLFVLGVCGYIAFKHFTDSSFIGSDKFYITLAVVIGLAFVSVYLWMSGHHSHVKFDNSTGKIIRRQRDGFKRTEEIKEFSEFDQIDLEKALGSATTGKYLFDAFVSFKDGGRWHLQRIETHSEEEATAQKTEISEFVDYYLETKHSM